MEKSTVTEVNRVESETSHHVESKAATEGFAARAARGILRHETVQSVALTNAIAKDNHQNWTKIQFQLYAIMAFATLNGIMNGYDASVMSSINAMDPFHEFFNVGKTGSTIGLVFAIFTAGNIIGAAVSGIILDTLGRRKAMGLGAIIVILGTILQAASFKLNQFIAGRFLVGLGVPIATTSAPCYIVELAYPTWRGLAGGLYNVLGWFIGSLTASWSSYGTGFMTSNWSWRIPYIIQVVPSTVIFVVVWFVPESPRWLVSKNRIEEARTILIKYHGNGDPNSAVVNLEMEEIQQSLGTEAELNRGAWWDYRLLVNSRRARYRMWIIMLVSVFSQFIGGSVISYYMPTILEGVGITSSSKQLLLNALNVVVSFVSGLAGAFFVDKFGRRRMLLWGTFLNGLVYIPINVLAAKADGNISQASGYAFIAMIFLYGVFFCFCWTPLQALYPAEVLNNEIRAKGMAAQGLIAGLAGFINMYATPVALHDIGWKTYTIFLVFHAVHWVLMYFVTVETKGRSLEELEEIFNDPHPMKRSRQKTAVVVSAGVGVKVEESP